MKHSEAWIYFTDACKQAGVSEKTGYNHLKYLREQQPGFYNRIVRRKGNRRQVKSPQFINHLKEDLRKMVKKKSIPQNQKIDREKNHSVLPEEIQEKARELCSTSITLQRDPDIENILNKIKDRIERDILWFAVLICADYETGFYPIEECCKRNSIDPATFWRWREKYENVNYLFQKAKRKRKESNRERRIEKAEYNLEKLGEGYELKAESYTYQIDYDDDGNELEIPKEKKTMIKEVGPNFDSNKLTLTNLDSNNWSNSGTTTQPIANDPILEENVENMSTEEIAKLIKKEEIKIRNLKKQGL